VYFIIILKMLITFLFNVLLSKIYFSGYLLEDLWLMDSCIPLKYKILVELVRSAVFWVI
jgi:hypothetical protein